MTHPSAAPVFLPRTRSCLVCGVENPRGLRTRSRVEDGRVVIDYAARPEDCGYRNRVHGGLAMTLADEVMTWAAILSSRRLCVAAEMTTRLRRPMSAGETYRIEGWVVRASGRLIRTEARISGADGVERVRTEGKYLPMPEEEWAQCEKDFVDRDNWPWRQGTE